MFASLYTYLSTNYQTALVSLPGVKIHCDTASIYTVLVLHSSYWELLML